MTAEFDDEFVPSMIIDEPGSSAPAPTPRELPDLRLRLVRMWEPGALFDRVVRAKIRADIEQGISLPGTHDGTAYARWEHDNLRRARLWYVAEPMCRLLYEAAKGVPDDVLFSELPEPSDPTLRAGFAVLEQPFEGTSAETGERLDVAALTWGPCRLPPLARYPGGIDSIGVASYGTYMIPNDDPKAAEGGIQSYRGADGTWIKDDHVTPPGERLWWPAGRTDWPLPDRIAEPPWEMSDVALASYVEDRKLLAALWVLLHQQGIATTTTTRQPRPTRRRTERAGLHGDLSDVRLVTLRVARPSGTHAEHDGERKFSVRWPVEGHWRNQPYGPGRSLRRLQYINPYIKGPEGAPLKEAATVRVWKR